jgi:hypothetical protein
MIKTAGCNKQRLAWATYAARHDGYDVLVPSERKIEGAVCYRSVK